jgi:hypothetical protein
MSLTIRALYVALLLVNPNTRFLGLFSSIFFFSIPPGVCSTQLLEWRRPGGRAFAEDLSPNRGSTWLRVIHSGNLISSALHTL